MRAGRTRSGLVVGSVAFSFVSGSEAVKDKLLSGVGDMISTHLAREVAVLEGEGGSKNEKDRRKGPAQGSKRHKDPAILHSACIWFVSMPLVLVAWQVMAMGRLMRTRGSVMSINGRVNIPEFQFYVRLKI